MAQSNFSWQRPQDWIPGSENLAEPLHARCRWRLPLLLAGMLFAQGRRTVTTWLRAAGIGNDYQDYYYFLSSLGRQTRSVAVRLLSLVLRAVPLPSRVIAVIDDSPTKRYGKHVEGAAIHHNPTPGPADQQYLYGHVWVTLSLAIRHPAWGALALPLRAMLYVREQTLSKIPEHRGWKFATKLELAAELVEWLALWLQIAKKTLWVVVDGGYTKGPFLKRALATGATIIGRLRKDAALFAPPPELPPGKKRGRGRPCKYGQSIHLAKRAGHRQGWQSLSCVQYGRSVVKTYKTFIAMYQPTGGAIRVVIVKELHGWFPFFSTDINASVQEILEAFADRATIEQDFHDVKEVWGAGQQQVRNIWTNVAVYNLNLWMHTLVELWAWNRPHTELCDRGSSPWDDAGRRPSHANRRAALRREIAEKELSLIAQKHPLPRKILDIVAQLLALAA